jgi:hypothetical protein
MIFDNRMIHMSFENESDRHRVAIGLWCHETGGELVHFANRGTTEAVRYTVDEWFYLTETPFTLAERDPNYPIAERFTVEPVDSSLEMFNAVTQGVATSSPPATQPARSEHQGETR